MSSKNFTKNYICTLVTVVVLTLAMLASYVLTVVVLLIDGNCAPKKTCIVKRLDEIHISLSFVKQGFQCTIKDTEHKDGSTVCYLNAGEASGINNAQIKQNCDHPFEQDCSYVAMIVLLSLLTALGCPWLVWAYIKLYNINRTRAGKEKMCSCIC